MSELKVSILMPVYNGESHLKEAIDSILAQSFRDFEFLIIDDGSTDETLDILNEYVRKDERVRVIINKENIGLTKSLNKGIHLANGKYIARMDADDISNPDRLKLQVEFLETNLDHGLVGSWSLEMDEKGNKSDVGRELPVESEKLVKDLISYNPFFHSSIMMRKNIFEKTGLYNEEWKYAQDYELYFRISRFYKIANLPFYLMAQRRSPYSISQRKSRAQAFFAAKARMKAVRKGFYSKWAYLYVLRAYIGWLLPKWLKGYIRRVL